MQLLTKVPSPPLIIRLTVQKFSIQNQPAKYIGSKHIFNSSVGDTFL